MDNTIQDYIQFLSNQDIVNDKCREFILQYSTIMDNPFFKMDEDRIRELIMDYIKTDMYNRYNEIETFIHQHPLFTPG